MSTRVGWFALVLVAGCPAEDDPEGSASGSGSGSASGTSQGPTGCESLESPMTDEIPLVLTNNRADAIFLDAGCGASTLILSQVNGTASFAADTCDAPTCDAVVGGDCSTACAACLPGVIRIEPGTPYMQVWAGTIFEDRDVTGVCENLCTDRCWQDSPAPDGDYRLRANVFLECPETLDNCDCPAGSTPPCFIEAYDGAVNAEERSVDFAMPNTGPILLDID